MQKIWMYIIANFGAIHTMIIIIIMIMIMIIVIIVMMIQETVGDDNIKIGAQQVSHAPGTI